MMTPIYRKLRGYAFDPSFSFTLRQRSGNEVIYKIYWEEVTPGPSGEYIEVVDYDPTRECFYEPVDLNHPYVLADHGLAPSEGNPCFHQQQVYAIIMSTIMQFEKALGTKIIWSRLTEGADGKMQEVYEPRLRVYPHALRQQNAYYSPQKLSLLFGYFRSASHWGGRNVPETLVFTCLSPDIVAHEATHAILDSLYPYLKKDTNPDMLAFHEGFADIIALLQRFTIKEVVKDQLRLSGGDFFSPENMLGDLAIQFGEAVSPHLRALRSYLVEKKDGQVQILQPDPSRYQAETDPHARGAILVAAVFHAFVHLYQQRTADLMRLGANDTSLHPDLVNRLADEACNIAGKLLMICIRALDFCPPVDMNFGDYLRALITADVEHDQADEGGLRYALLESFRNWGIIPKDVVTYSVESLMWKPLAEYFNDDARVSALNKCISGLFDENADASINFNLEKILRENNRAEIYAETKKLAAAIHDAFSKNINAVSSNLERLLGMSFGPVNYLFKDKSTGKYEDFAAGGRNIFQVYKCRPVLRYNNATGRFTKLLVVSLVQKIPVDLTGSSYKGYWPGDTYNMRGGATLVIDLADYSIRYVIFKNIASSTRLQKQLAYALEHIYNNENAALLLQQNEPFAALHAIE